MSHISALMLGPFSLENPIARGGMCEVWEGTHVTTQMPVAIKVVHEKKCQAPEYVSAFYDEIRTLAGLSHEGIVGVYDFGRIPSKAAFASGGRLSEGSPYLVMERASRSLKPYCGHIPWEAIRGVLLNLLDALAHAHARGIIHRDIKPQNVLVFTAIPEVKLTDFGIAHALEQEGPDGTPEYVEGTPSYMAPEQFTGLWRDYGPWTDLYALGCAAFELVGGRPPFSHRKSLRDLFLAHVTEAPPPLKKKPDVPEAFEQWVLTLMAKQPHQRFSCAADAFRALESLGASHVDAKAWLKPLRPATLPPPLPGAALAQESDKSEHTLDVLTLFQPKEMRATLQTALRDVVETQHEMTMVQDAILDVSYESESAEQLESASWASYSNIPAIWLEEPQAAAAVSVLQDAGLSLFPYRTLPLINRGRERNLLWKGLRELHISPRARMMQVWGPAGFGKSRLVQWLCESAHERGLAHVLKALHSPNAGSFHGLRAMLERELRCTGLDRAATKKRLEQKLPAEAMDIPNGYLALTEFLHPTSLAERTQEHGLSQLQRIEEHHAVLFSYLQYLCERKPVLLWLEDIQWGMDTLSFVSYLMQQQAQTPLPIMCVLVVREEELKEYSWEAEQLSTLLADAHASVIEVGPLSVTDREALMRAIGLGDELAQVVQRVTKGNPMFAVQLVSDWVDRELLVPESDGYALFDPESVSFPTDFEQFWRERLDRVLGALPYEAGRSLELAACLGQVVDYCEWCKVCEQAGIIVSQEIVEKAITQQLARWDDDSQQSWSFVNVTVRESLCQRAREQGRWEEHHFYCAAAILQERDILGAQERLGRHYWWAGAHNAAMAAFLKAIHAYLEGGAYRKAERLFDEWERRLDEMGLLSHHTYWGELGLLKIKFARTNNLYVEALKHAESVYLEAKKHNWHEIRLRALLELGFIGWRAGYAPSQVEVCLQQAEGLALQINDPQLLGKSRCISGDYFNFHGKPEQALGFFQRALDGFEDIDDNEGMGQAYLGMAWAYRQQSRLDEATEQLHHALFYFKVYGSWDGIARCLSTLGDLARLRGDFDGAEQHYKESMHHYRTIGSGGVGLSQLNLAFVMVMKGRAQEAAPYLQHALDTFADGGRRDLEGAAYLAWLVLLAERQDWQRWDHTYVRMTQLLEETGLCDLDLAALATLAGDRARDAHQPERAQQIYQVAFQLWYTLQRDDQVQRLLASMQTKV